MAFFERLASPFAETEPPPPPIVLLLLQTDLNMRTSTSLIIHEDLEKFVPSTRKTVQFAPSVEHTYPPPPIFLEKIPVPQMLTRRSIEGHDGWECGEKETALIKAFIHDLVDKLLDNTRSFSHQDPERVQDVFTQAAQMHPVLRKYADDWATRCIVQARLKATAATANKRATKEAAEIIVSSRRTRRKSDYWTVGRWLVGSITE
ncbi:hypothetical protein B0H12DRAFT_1070640 [Mycena haematopus]|nr:hypothetical protein B0H12DRAFT_1070640 [Mycena haematopus]